MLLLAKEMKMNKVMMMGLVFGVMSTGGYGDEKSGV
jgi:hypothetical protein